MEIKESDEAEAEAPDTSGIAHSDKTILLVDDSADMLEMLSRIFAPQYRVLTARDGREGLEMARGERPDLIVSDVMMPQMSGTEMCAQIKSHIDLCHIPVVLLTALDGEDRSIEGLQRGADDYITKPFSARVLLARCNNLIRTRQLIHQQMEHKPIDEIELTAVTPLDQDLLRRTTEAIDRHIADEHFDIPALCEELGMGRTLFYAKCKALTGMTPNSFVLNYRLKRAAILLRSRTDLQVAEIGYRLGFGSPVYFRRCFKAQYGVSPQDYRKG